jgi:hypothetical protein
MTNSRTDGNGPAPTEQDATKPLTNAQFVFDKTVKNWASEQAKLIIENGDDLEAEIAEIMSWLPYSFHTQSRVSVDATLYDILNYGGADYGFGRSLYTAIHEAMREIGYYLENYNGCDWIFVEAEA